VENAARTGRREIYKQFWYENLKERDHSDKLCVDGRIILKYILKK
jgi:hypothetical protein